MEREISIVEKSTIEGYVTVEELTLRVMGLVLASNQLYASGLLARSSSPIVSIIRL